MPSPTGAVYRAYDQGSTAAADRPEPPGDWTVSAVIDWLAMQRNDLEAPAVALEPAIGVALGEATRLSGVRLVRMSGSGATVFALFDSLEASTDAARGLSIARPDGWVRATTLQ